jgi:hypothetical protein
MSPSNRFENRERPNESEPVPHGLLTRVLADPLVRRACQLFDAEVVEVKALRLKL